MGVKGLLPLLKSIHKHTHLKVYTGQTLGIDGFGWLHRGACACALQLALDRPTTRYIDFVLNRIRMLLDFGITPYLVFDGDAVPSKAGTNTERRKERKAAKENGLSLYRAGKQDAAQQELQKAVTVTPDMTFRLILELRRMNITFVVAPYEADAQLAYLEKQGIIDGVLSEDSDLLVFGVKKLITKLDQHGDCVEINRADLILNKDVSFAGWSDSMFRRMAILSGCDYLPQINRIGLKTAHAYVKKHKEIHKILRVLSFDGKYTVPTDYSDRFRDAERAFLYHRVFCPKQRKIIHLNELPPGLAAHEMPFLGEDVSPDVAIGVAAGDLNPKTKEPFNGQALPATRPVLQENRRQTLASTDLKPKRSLDNFFRPSRRPLAELDPNSLTPSPSQQRLLDRNRNASWEPILVNSAPPLRRSITDVMGPRGEINTNRWSRDNFLARTSASSTFKPIKRQRLCSETDETAVPQDVEHSRFFSTDIVEQTPSKSRKVRDRKAKKGGFDLWSDDSVEGILLGLEDPLPAETKKVDVVEYPMLPPAEPEEIIDVVEAVPQSSPVIQAAVLADSQSSHGTVELGRFTFDSRNAWTPQLSRQVSQEDDPEAFVSLLEFHVTQVNQSVRAKSEDRVFSARSHEQQLSAFASLSKPVALNEGSSKNSLDGKVDEIEPAETVDDKINAEDTFLAEDQEQHVVFASPAKPSLSTLAKTFAFQSGEKQRQAFQSLATKVHLSPSITPIASRSALRELNVLDVQGTEDLLVSSPTRTEDYVSEAEEPPKATFNLGRFLCRT